MERPRNKGKTVSKETRANMSKAQKESKLSQEWRKKLHKFTKGKHLSPKTEFKKGKHYSTITEFKKGQIPWNKDLPFNEQPNFQGGIRRAGGYIFIKFPNHPFSRKDNYIMEHRLVVEKYLGRYLTKKEKVHHINKNPSDNRVRNLMVFANNAYHIWFHRKGSCNPIGILFDGSKF